MMLEPGQSVTGIDRVLNSSPQPSVSGKDIGMALKTTPLVSDMNIGLRMDMGPTLWLITSVSDRCGLQCLHDAGDCQVHLWHGHEPGHMLKHRHDI